ncbi:Uncharacterized inner membrane transporter yedA [Delftia tsuruhatensis]|uniref:DMT family transporter n=1 Tax=Delftia tsuruhatensis TaxID=180282 RepID=UPI001E6BC72E|nr:EamA family transporter [Delftia tsuruhatensis]CAB5670929.1 Uncharacterized inner membrane transporter yedA [Delftia tsuruhatensis]CAC9683109.1 Uncharacterized inner membrane transporter yedA [Delftia tsuruhatensis]
MERFWILLAGSLFSLLWASAFIAGKIALQYSEPLSLLCLRFAIAGTLMLAWCILCNRTRGVWNRALLLDGIVLGLLNNALYLGLSFQGLRTVSPEATILIVSTAPFFTFFFSILSGTRCSLRQLAGMTMGISGVYIVVVARMRGNDDPWGMLLVLMGTMSFAIGTVWYRYRATKHSPLALNGVQNLAGALSLLPFSSQLSETFLALKQVEFLTALLYLVIVVSIFDFLLWLALLRRIEAAYASSFHLLNPVFGIILAALVFGAAISVNDVLGTLIIIAGLALVSWPKNQKNTPSTSPTTAR